MLQSYEAIYERGRLHWLDEMPDKEPVRVIVTVVEPAVREESKTPNGRELAQLLRQMAAAGAAEAFGDPLEWQREVRTDRVLPGREEE
jgi:hypothetical protein